MDWRTLSSVTGFTVCGALIARETVAIEKPACAATSLMVGVIAVFPLGL